MAFDIFGNDSKLDKTIKYKNSDGSEKKFTINNKDLANTLAAQNIFTKEDMKWYTKFNRYGYINPYNETANREFLFFTKPDLNIFTADGADYNALTLNPDLQNIPIFTDAAVRYRNSLTQLQSSVRDINNRLDNPFMCLLSNYVTSRLDLPSITADTTESSANMYGTTIQYRGHSLKSDTGYDFNLSFTDNKNLDLYMLVKLYDEYIRLQKAGEVSPRKRYIIRRILAEQFSIYKFIVGADGETILYFAKATGVYFADVPRGDMGDPGQDGFKFSLSFHAQFIEDSNPSILSDFNILTRKVNNDRVDFSICDGTMPVYNKDLSVVNNNWAGLPYIARVDNNSDVRAAKAAREDHGNYIYLLKWRE